MLATQNIHEIEPQVKTIKLSWSIYYRRLEKSNDFASDELLSFFEWSDKNRSSFQLNCFNIQK